MSAAASASQKIDVSPECWDNIFAPSSCLVLITTVDREGRVNGAAFGTCTRGCPDPMYNAFTCRADKGTPNNVHATPQVLGKRGPLAAAHWPRSRALRCGP